VTIENAEGRTPPLRPAAGLRMRAKRVLEYSAALPLAESAEAAGSFRDQGLTGKSRWRQGVPPASLGQEHGLTG
jgi:hypothetical protein